MIQWQLNMPPISRRQRDEALTMLLGDLPGFRLDDIKEVTVLHDRVRVVQYVRDEHGNKVLSHSGVRDAADPPGAALTHTAIILTARE